MSNPGIGVMLHALSGGSKHDPKDYVGLNIISAKLDDNQLKISFNNGKTVRIYDNGQSCCEVRYMRTDDNVEFLVGKTFQGIECKSAEDANSEYSEVHEIVFLEIKTDKGSVTFSNHNEHNGYYGGFGLTIDED